MATDEGKGEAAAGQWEVLYFDAPTRGEQMRLLLAYAGLNFKDTRLKKFPSDLDPYRHAAMGDDSPLLFDQCPMVRSPDGTTVVQAAACMQYIGRWCSQHMVAEGLRGLAPEDPAIDARCLSLTLFSEELRNSVFYKALMPEAIKHVLGSVCCGFFCCLRMCIPCCGCGRHGSKIRRTFHEKIKLLDTALRTARTIPKCGTGPYFCGQVVTYCDVALLDCIREILALPMFDRKHDLADFPRLASWLERMESRPGIAAYYAGHPSRPYEHMIPHFVDATLGINKKKNEKRELDRQAKKAEEEKRKQDQEEQARRLLEEQEERNRLERESPDPPRVFDADEPI